MSHRQINRINIDRPILLKLSSGMTVKARIRNISAGGIAILYPAPAEINAVLGLHFQLPDKNNEPHTIQCKGIVRNCHIYQHQFVTGIEFKGLDEVDLSVVDTFIRIKMSRQNMLAVA